MMDKHEQDDGFDKVFEEAVRSGFHVEIPDPDLSWNKMAVKIAKQARKRRMRKRIQMVGVAASALLIGAVLFSTPKETEAFLPVSKFLSDVKEEVVTLVQGNKKVVEQEDKSGTGMLTSPPPAGVGPILGSDQISNKEADYVQATTFEEAKKQVQTQIPEMGFVPDGYTLQNIQLSLNEGKMILRGIYQYEHKDHQGFLVLHISSGSHTETSIQTNNQEADVKKMQIQGYAAKLIDDGSNRQLIWSNGRYVFMAIGTLSEEELLRIAENVK